MHSFKGYDKVDALNQTRLEAKRKTRRRIIIISISTVVLVAIIAGVAVGVVRSKNKGNDESLGARTTSKAMKAVCDATLYPDVCVSSLSSYPGASNAGPKDLVHFAVEVAMGQVQKALGIFSNIAQNTTDPKLKAALEVCEEMMDQTNDQLNSSNADLKNFNLKSLMEPAGDVKTWLSSALTDLDTCFDGLEDTGSSDVRAKVQSVTDNLTKLISNCLAIVNTISDVLRKLKLPFGSRRLLSKEFQSVEDGSPMWLSAADRKLLQAREIIANVTVAADGSGDYRTIQEAVDAAPEKSKTRFIIKVKKGVYKENVEISKKKTMIMMTGDGIENTIVTGDKNVVDGTPTFRTATFIAVGKGFIAVDMQFTNTAGPSKHQAVALRVGSDESIILRCKITAYQDTLYAHSQRQFYRDCYISGTVDFIFGNAAVVLQNCTIAARLPNPNQQNTITAQGRTDPGQTTGISIHLCNFIGEKNLIESKTKFRTYLGRPWKQYSRTVIMVSEMSDIIEPVGWLEWNGDFALKTLYYGEYMNTGAGAQVANRVKWPGYKVIDNDDEAKQFTVPQFIGNSWLDTAGVAVSYTEGLNA